MSKKIEQKKQRRDLRKSLFGKFLKRREQKKLIELLEVSGKETHATVALTAEAGDGGNRKKKGIAVVHFTDESGKERKAMFRIESPDTYFKGEDVVIRYTTCDDGSTIALPAASFKPVDKVQEGWNKILWRTVIQVLKVVMKYAG